MGFESSAFQLIGKEISSWNNHGSSVFLPSAMFVLYLRIRRDLRVLFLMPAWAAISVQLQIITSGGSLASSNAGSTGKVWLLVQPRSWDRIRV